MESSTPVVENPKSGDFGIRYYYGFNTKCPSACEVTAFSSHSIE